MFHSMSLGNFDGVHLGHGALVNRVLELSKTSPQCVPAVLTFEPHPREFLGIRPIPERLCTFEEKERRLSLLGMQKLYVQPFDADFANMTANEFLSWLQSKYSPRHLVIGRNFCFGKNRCGNAETLRIWGAEHGVHVEILAPVEVDGIRVSSTQIRGLIQCGEIRRANLLCGYSYSVPLEKCEGDHRGRKLGFPTLNSRPPVLNPPATFCLPPHGVYVSRLRVDAKAVSSITNFGVRPTFHEAQEGEFFETHVLSDWDERLSFGHLSVELIDRIRPERRFSSKDELIQQIQEDIAIAKRAHHLP